MNLTSFLKLFFIHSAVVFLSGICRPNSITLVVIKSKLHFRGVFSVTRSYTDLCRCGPRILISVSVNVTYSLKTYFMSVLIMTSLYMQLGCHEIPGKHTAVVITYLTYSV